MPEVTVVAKRFTLVQAANAAGFRLSVFYSKAFCAMPEAHEARRDVTRTRGALFASTLPPSVVPLGVFGAERGRTSDR